MDQLDLEVNLDLKVLQGQVVLWGLLGLVAKQDQWVPLDLLERQALVEKMVHQEAPVLLEIVENQVQLDQQALWDQLDPQGQEVLRVKLENVVKLDQQDQQVSFICRIKFQTEGNLHLSTCLSKMFLV